MRNWKGTQNDRPDNAVGDESRYSVADQLEEITTEHAVLANHLVPVVVLHRVTVGAVLPDDEGCDSAGVVVVVVVVGAVLMRRLWPSQVMAAI